jgi:site-specific recombinase XerD
LLLRSGTGALAAARPRWPAPCGSILRSSHESEEGSCLSCSIGPVDALAGDHAWLSRRTPATQQGARYPADPPTVEQIVAVMRAAGDRRHGRRLRALIVVLWRAGVRIHEARALSESGLDRRRGALVVRPARADAAERSAWTSGAGKQLQPWLDQRLELQVGALFCVIKGPTRGRPWSAAAVRPTCGARPRPPACGDASHRITLRHAHAVEMGHEGVPLIVIQHQLGHGNHGITSLYLQGIDNAEIIDAVHARRAPMLPVSASLCL